MKLKKRFAAMGAAMVMAVTGMSMNVSASWSFNLHYVPVGSVTNVTHQSKNVKITSRTQSLEITSFYRSNNTGYVKAYNHLSSSMVYIFTTTGSSSTITVPTAALGVTVPVEAWIYNYSGSYVNSTGQFNGVTASQ